MKNSKVDFAAARKLIMRSQNITLVSHEHTDGDDLGAMLSLASVLFDQGKSIIRVAHGGVDNDLLPLPGSSAVLDEPPTSKPDLIIFFGCADSKRTGFEDWDITGVSTINIDHHPDNKLFADVNMVEPEAAATCEIVYNFILYLDHPITRPIATNLLAGIFADTGGFRHANTSAEVLEIAATLVRRGARIDRIAETYFGHNKQSKLRAWAKAFENARFDPEQQMLYSIVTEEDLAEIGATSDDLEGVAEMLNTVPEARFSMVLKQRGDRVQGSLRSEEYKGVDVSEIARTFGGGGHKLAAGFKFKGKIERTSEGWRIT